MDSGANSDGSSDDISLPPPLSLSVVRAVNHMEKHNKRRATDKYWSVFFGVIFISWMSACQYVTHQQTDYSILSDDSSYPENISEFAIIPDDNTATMNISDFLHEEMNDEAKVESQCKVKRRKQQGLSERLSEVGSVFFAIFTFDLSRMTDKGDDCNALAVSFCINGVPAFIAFFILIHRDKMLRKQPLVIGATFLFVALLEHLSAMFYASNLITFTLLSSHEKVTFWIIPEVILLIILCIMKKYAGVPPKKSDDYDDEIVSSHVDYKFTVSVGIPVFVTLQLLGFYTMSLLQNVIWGSALSYVIGLGSCYVALTIYYFGAMVISCSIRVSNDVKNSRLTNLFPALLIVARCHFGTACYHATLIIPRIHATIVTYDSKLRTLSKYSRFDRFLITHLNVHNFLTTVTAVYGTNYAKSLRELLRLWPNGVIKEKYHFYYNSLSVFLSIFILLTNSAMLMLLWVYNQDDPQFSLATRAMYLKIMFMFFLACPYLQATSDAHVFVYCRSLVRDSTDCFFSRSLLMQYFSEFETSDDDTDSDDSGMGHGNLM